jgi:nucleotide-binding universal stress UspA family protein
MVTNGNNENKYEKIVMIPTDFSEVCDNAIHHGVELAQSLQYNVCILHVINKETKAFLKKEKLPLDHIQEKLTEYKNRYEKEAGIRVETIAREGSIFDVINEVAEEVKAHMMILGTHGKQGLQHLFGSYALRVVLDSPCPVVVVQKRTFGEGYHNIIFPITNDLEVRQKVEWALLMARLFNSRFQLYVAREKDQDLNNRLQVITQQITKVFDEKKISYGIEMAEKPGDFEKQVVAYAVQKKSDMIMIITIPAIDNPGFSVSGWGETMMFNEAQIPVMCINPSIIGKYYYEWITLI